MSRLSLPLETCRRWSIDSGASSLAITASACSSLALSAFSASQKADVSSDVQTEMSLDESPVTRRWPHPQGCRRWGLDTASSSPSPRPTSMQKQKPQVNVSCMSNREAILESHGENDTRRRRRWSPSSPTMPYEASVTSKACSAGTSGASQAMSQATQRTSVERPRCAGPLCAAVLRLCR